MKSMLAVAVVVVLGMPASATTYVVAPDGGGDFPTIQAAIDACSSGDTIELTDGTFTGAGNRDLLVSIPLIIRAQSGPGGSCIIDCQGSPGEPHRGIEIDDNAGAATLEGISIQNAWVSNEGGGVLFYEVSLIIDACIFVGNHAETGGGAIASTIAGDLVITGSLLAGNSTNQTGPGGAIYLDDGSLAEITGCMFNANWGDPGGVLYLSYSEATLTECSIKNSDGPMSNVALYADNNSSLHAHNTIIAFGTDEAVACAGGSGAVMYCCDIYGNAGGDWTGCIMSQEGVYGNISADPLFCWPYGSPFGLAENSPCAEENNPECGQIGASGIDCGPAIYAVRADGSGDYPTIQAAIDAAAAGSIVELADGTYTGDGNRDIDLHGKVLTVRSASGVASQCVIDCQGGASDPHRGFHLHSGETRASVVEGVRVQNGWMASAVWPTNAGGGMCCEPGCSPTFRNCHFIDNSANAGGGVYCEGPSSPLFENCVISQNGVNWNAGGIYLASECAAELYDCEISGNVGGSGPGGVFCHQSSAVELYGCTISDNTVDEDGTGGGISVCWGSSITLEDCLILGNRALDGGGIYCEHADCSLRLVGCELSGNVADSTSGKGGGLHLVSASAVVEDCDFIDNLAWDGGGVFLESTGPSFDRCEFSADRARRVGGGLCVSDSAGPELRDCLFYGNSAGVEGGGIVFHSSWAFSNPTLERCQFVGNSAPFGAGLYGLLTGGAFTECTLAGNVGDMGGAMAWFESRPLIRNCTLYHNAADLGGGITLFEDHGTVLENTIIAGSISGEAIHCAGGTSPPLLSCCDLYGNDGGDWIDCIADQFGVNGNISEDPLFCGAENPAEPLTLDESSPCAEENNYECGQIGAWPVGCWGGSEVEDELPRISADALHLSHPQPNPAISQVRVRYTIPSTAEGSSVRLRVLDASGRLVRTLRNGLQAPGIYEAVWDGADLRNRPAAGGIYYYQLTMGADRTTRRVTLIR